MCYDCSANQPNMIRQRRTHTGVKCWKYCLCDFYCVLKSGKSREMREHFLSKFMLVIWFLKSFAICDETKINNLKLNETKWSHLYNYSLELICYSLDYFWIFKKGEYRNHHPEVNYIFRHFLVLLLAGDLGLEVQKNNILRESILVLNLYGCHV